MKTSWVIGVFVFYLLIFAAEMMVTGGSFGPTTTSGALVSPSIASSSNSVSQWFTVMASGFNYFISFIGVLFLYSPSVFPGNYVWMWWFICLPVDVGMIFGIVTMLRGSASS